MMYTRPYIRERAILYAAKWAFSRNPLFYDFTGIGGNCTNFVSQALYAGSCKMNYTPTFGWYYISDADRAPAWTGVDFFYNFITSNEGVGPFGREVPFEELLTGDVVQLGRKNEGYYHTMLVVKFADGVPLVAAQSNDAYNRPLDSYDYDFLRFIHIDGVRTNTPSEEDCFASLYQGIAIVQDGEGRSDASQ